MEQDPVGKKIIEEIKRKLRARMRMRFFTLCLHIAITCSVVGYCIHSGYSTGLLILSVILSFSMGISYSGYCALENAVSATINIEKMGNFNAVPLDNKNESPDVVVTAFEIEEDELKKP